MALIKNRKFKGYDWDYWIIYEVHACKKANLTYVTMALYKDQAAREENLEGHILLESHEIEGLDHTRGELYAALKISKPATEEDVEYGRAEEVGEELNWFVDATDS